MNIIIITDIFGLTPALLTLSQTLKANTIVDPYQGQQLAFENEADAYAYFSENVGLDAYLAQLQKIVSLAPIESILIGFSIGATTMWRLSETTLANRIEQGFGFYGGQIRKYTDIKPHFSIDELQNTLDQTQRVKMLNSNYYHGFMNIYSDNYHEDAYHQQVKRLLSIIE